tara:strand:+ start:112 stop:429 length:318 start_codon:yes stop_codon:yes gene_type:complete
MIAALLLILIFVSGLLGSVWLSLSQPRNLRRVVDGNGAPTPPVYFRPLGWTLLAVSFGLCVLRDGGGFAFLLLPLVFTLSACLVAWMLAFYPSALRFLVSSSTSS